MLSVQRMAGRPALFFGLLEQSATLAQESVAMLQRIIIAGEATPPDLEGLRELRRRDKAVFKQLEDALTRFFTTPIEREDLESIALSLYRIPKDTEMVGEIYGIVHHLVGHVDFSIPLQMLANAAQIVRQMVGSLAKGEKLSTMKSLDARLSQIQADSTTIINHALRQVYEPGGDPLQEIAIHDVYRATTHCFDSCRSCGRLIALICLKIS
jgi:hypothetical protein